MIQKKKRNSDEEEMDHKLDEEENVNEEQMNDEDDEEEEVDISGKKYNRIDRNGDKNVEVPKGYVINQYLRVPTFRLADVELNDETAQSVCIKDERSWECEMDLENRGSYMVWYIFFYIYTSVINKYA